MNDTVACPSCRRALRVPENLQGQPVRCPACGTTFTAEDDARPPRRRAEGRVEYVPPRDEQEEERPRRARRRWDDEEDEDRPRRRREEEDDYDVRRRREERPGKVQAIGIMMLVGGILALLVALGLMATCIGFLWPGTYYSVVLGILALVKASALLGGGAHREKPPTAIAVMQIINVLNLDLINLTLGILALVFLADPEVKRFFRR
jgi:hypothetical protein